METREIRRTLDPGFQSSAISLSPNKIDFFGCSISRRRPEARRRANRYEDGCRTLRQSTLALNRQVLLSAIASLDVTTGGGLLWQDVEPPRLVSQRHRSTIVLQRNAWTNLKVHCSSHECFRAASIEIGNWDAIRDSLTVRP